MLKFIGNCSHIIDWNNVVKEIENIPPAYVGPRHDVDSNIEGVNEVIVPLKKAGYIFRKDKGNAGWNMYFPGIQFSADIVEKFMSFVNLKNCMSCWISRVNSGDVAPWHWDITDDENTLNLTEEIKRFHCHMDIPRPGHVFIVEDTCLYNQEQGNVYQWPNRKSWHAGANAGLTPKYLFNIWGS
jgi:hypothetical protein